jgi:hypothetical protein
MAPAIVQKRSKKAANKKLVSKKRAEEIVQKLVAEKQKKGIKRKNQMNLILRFKFINMTFIISC